MATEIDRSIPTVNRLQGATTNFGVQETAVNTDKAAAKSKVAPQSNALTVSAQLASEAAQAVVDDIPLPKGDGLSTAQLEKLLARLSMMTREQQYKQGLEAVDNLRIMTTVVGLATVDMVANVQSSVVRNESTKDAMEALFLISQRELNYLSWCAAREYVSSDAAWIAKDFVHEIIYCDKTADDLAEDVLKFAWERDLYEYTPEALKSTAAQLVEILKQMDQFVAKNDAVEEAKAVAAETKAALKKEKERFKKEYAECNEARDTWDGNKKKAELASSNLGYAQRSLAEAKEKLNQALAGNQNNAQSAEVEELKAKVATWEYRVSAAQENLVNTQQTVEKSRKDLREQENNTYYAWLDAKEASSVNYTAQSGLKRAKSRAIRTFMKTYEDVINALAIYTDDMQEANDTFKKRNIDIDDAAKEIRKELLRRMAIQDKLADKLAQILANVANGIVVFQEHLTKVLTEAVDTDDKIREELIV